ncbi:MAG TPA: potassium transporter TrkG [Candidatus Limiplasma sp.]|nr:potassium transporter TrkG [Candidatus Limiplasma sp.]HPS81390.1 potassium transporter TrkG [Candidatus Limiplasma sp.]
MLPVRSERRIAFFQRTIRPERVMALGFLCVILVGTLLLTLPISANSGRSVGVHNAMFTATSAVCVTGLITVDTADTYTTLGRVVILLLIQIGGLGFMIFATLVMVALGKRISLRNRVLIRESMNMTSLGGMVRLAKWFSMLAFLIEGSGAILLCTRFIPLLGFKRGLWYGVFHAVSAFCNAGFDLFGGFKSLIDFQHDPVVLLTIASLIICGGLGFSVINEFLHNRFHFHKFSLHAKLVLVVTAFLLVLGTALMLLLEWDNPGTLGDPSLSVGDKILNAFFQSTTLRTAGFASLNQAALTDSSKLISVILMFIGASPASTGGGVKTTTMSVVFLLVLSVVRGRDTVGVFGKQLAANTVKRALTIVIISLGIVLVCTCALSISERTGSKSMLDLVFEATSAFATVGLSAVNTATLNRFSQALLIPIMYFGRVGPLTLAFALASRMENNPKNRIHYPEDKIMIG